jgi:hypothetical protein
MVVYGVTTIRIPWEICESFFAFFKKNSTVKTIGEEENGFSGCFASRPCRTAKETTRSWLDAAFLVWG